MATFTTRTVAETLNASVLWDSLVSTSPLAGLWHTWAWHTYVLSEGKPFGARDHSFFIYADNTLVGLCPLILQQRTVGKKTWLVASYHTGLLPWPLTASSEAEDFAFIEMERLTRAGGASHIAFQLYATIPLADDNIRIERVTFTHRYIASQNRVQVVAVSGANEQIRERFRRYDKKFASRFDFNILEGDSVDAETEETYFRLHILDAGKTTRPQETYTAQADLARVGEAFYVSARHKESGEIAGMLFISLNKRVAFDNSVAINPFYTEYYVGHMLRFRAIEELKHRGVATYEMPLYAQPPSFLHIPSEKERSIVHFKEGFSRGVYRGIWKIEKFLDAAYLHAHIAERERSLNEFFLLD